MRRHIHCHLHWYSVAVARKNTDLFSLGPAAAMAGLQYYVCPGVTDLPRRLVVYGSRQCQHAPGTVRAPRALDREMTPLRCMAYTPKRILLNTPTRHFLQSGAVIYKLTL